MQSRTEYFLMLAREFTAFGLMNACATLIAFCIFLTVVIGSLLRKSDQERQMAHLPFKD